MSDPTHELIADDEAALRTALAEAWYGGSEIHVNQPDSADLALAGVS